MPHEWDHAYRVGVEAIDAQHRDIILQLDRLADAVSATRPCAAGRELRELMHQVTQHFADEERWMEEVAYPATRAHRHVHRQLTKTLQLAVRLRPEEDLSPRALWVIDRGAFRLGLHLRTEDMRFGRFNAARENLRELAEGGNAASRLRPLPGATQDAVRPPGGRGGRGQR